MFNEKELNEFVNRMFDNAKTNNDSVRTGLETFRKYLDETNMCSPEYLKKLDKIIECAPELQALKVKVDTLDVASFIEIESKKTPKEKPKQKTIGQMPSYTPSTNNHRSHYVEDSSGSCGGGRPTYRGC